MTGGITQTNTISSYFNTNKSKVNSGDIFALNKAKAAGEDTTAQFLNFTKMSIAERIRDQFLKSHNMTEDQLNKMSPEQREAFEKQIAQEIKESLTKRGLVSTTLGFDIRA
ncbi:MAG: hypothetical protein EB059_04625 [Alphaproteobacteria bacterium]|nr:hypothetical protein [Alphaproteobacteria bacterium]